MIKEPIPPLNKKIFEAIFKLIDNKTYQIKVVKLIKLMSRQFGASIV